MTRLHSEPVEDGVWFFLEALRAKGLSHGFVGKPFDFSKSKREQSAQKFMAKFGGTELAILNQIHSDSILFLPETLNSVPFAEGDGIIFPLITPGREVVVGVRTADCVPLIIVGRQWAAVVHAGWRGLALGIAERAVDALLKEEFVEDLVALVGPCAGGLRYEVGPEVIADLRDDAVATPAADDRFMLDLERTTAGKLKKCGVVNTYLSGMCTIADSRYHSFRRDREGMGSNLAFVVTRQRSS